MKKQFLDILAKSNKKKNYMAFKWDLRRVVVNK